MKRKIKVLKIKNNIYESVSDFVATEIPVTIKVNGEKIATILATPSNLSELACGFLLSNGKISSISDISSINKKDGEIDVRGNIKKDETSSFIITSGCGKGMINFKKKLVNSNFSISHSCVTKLIKEFQSMSLGFKETGGLHSAAICDKDKIIEFKEDIGRHNAVDKVIGSIFLKKMNFSDKVILTTGRITSEIVIKAMNSGIPIVISIGAVTDLAISLAEEGGITLIGFARGKRMNIYTNPKRIKNNPHFKGSIQEKIKTLCKKKNAIILAHNYQLGEIQDIADFVGDSLDLSMKAKETDADIIVFCGVHFMAEIAKILSPQKMVLIPDINAGCPLADMISVSELKMLKEKYPNALVVSYVNTKADVKAESDYCCTSRNGIDVINSIAGDKEIIFIPDKWLGSYILKKTKKNIRLWNGFCPTHLKIIKSKILKLKEKHPNAEVIVHPECTSDVIEIADFVYGTGEMINHVKKSQSQEFIIGTEIGIIHRLKKENPNKIFYPASELAICPNMKLTTLEKVLWALEDEEYKIEIKEEIMERARNAIERMFEITNIKKIC